MTYVPRDIVGLAEQVVAQLEGRLVEDPKPSQFGHYPEHWYAHIMHCFEVVAYCCPFGDRASAALNIYQRLVRNLHLYPETREQMLERLTEDRIATDTVVS